MEETKENMLDLAYKVEYNESFGAYMPHVEVTSKEGTYYLLHFRDLWFQVSKTANGHMDVGSSPHARTSNLVKYLPKQDVRALLWAMIESALLRHCMIVDAKIIFSVNEMKVINEYIDHVVLFVKDHYM